MLHPEVAPTSQAERLRSAMLAKAITHEQAVRADFDHVEVSARGGARELVYFCTMSPLIVRETIHVGDGAPLPQDVVVTGLAVEREGLYDVRNALIRSNGRIEVVIDEQTNVTPTRGNVFGMPVPFA